MAIVRVGEPGDNQLALEINNGDLKALRDIYSEWGFKDEESVLRFALAVLSKTTNKTIYYVDEKGEKVGLQPSDSVLKQTVESGPVAR